MEDAGDKGADLGCGCDPSTKLLALAPHIGAALTWSEPSALMVPVTPAPGSKPGFALQRLAGSKHIPSLMYILAPGF